MVLNVRGRNLSRASRSRLSTSQLSAQQQVPFNMAVELLGASLKEDRAARVTPIMLQGWPRSKIQSEVEMDSTSRFPSSPANAISHKYWETKQPLQPAEARALAFLRKLNRNCCNQTFKEDITFLVEGNEQIPAHRFILASKSPVFRKMFDSQMKETRTGEIEILDASGPVIRAMVDFCYTAEISFAEQVFPDEVLKVAHKYDLPELKCEAECELLKRITETNLVEALELSCAYQAEIVKQRCLDYLAHSIRVNSLNLCSLLRISYKYDVVPLKVRTLEFFRQNFEGLKFVVMDDLLSTS